MTTDKQQTDYVSPLLHSHRQKLFIMDKNYLFTFNYLKLPVNTSKTTFEPIFWIGYRPTNRLTDQYSKFWSCVYATKNKDCTTYYIRLNDCLVRFFFIEPNTSRVLLNFFPSIHFTYHNLWCNTLQGVNRKWPRDERQLPSLPWPT